MACDSLLNELNALVSQIGDGCCQPACAPSCCTPYTPCTFPFAQVTMTYPPPIPAPTRPEPVKPLSLPCPQPPPQASMSPEEREERRIDNFYNNYNIDWRNPDHYSSGPITCEKSEEKRHGVTVDGQSPCCNVKKEVECPDLGCPTGFKPCTMRLTPPPGCHPMLPWFAEVQPCPPKSKKKQHH